MMSDDAALSTQLINSLAAGADRGEFEFVGGSTYQVRIEGQPRSGSSTQMWAWLAGLERGRLLTERMDGSLRVDGWWSTGGTEAANARAVKARADVAEYRKILVDPSLVDQLRIGVLAAMETNGINFKELAARIGRTPQSVRDALSFSMQHPRVGTLMLFDEMIRGCGHRFDVSVSLPASTRSIKALAGPPDEPSGLTRMRALMVAVDARLIDGVSPSSVNRARKAREFVVEQAGATMTRPRQTLLHWLLGVADGSGARRAQKALAVMQEGQNVLPTS